MTITKFDSATCRAMHAEMLAAMQAVAEKRGLTVAYQGGSFDARTFKPKFEFAVTTTETGESFDIERQKFNEAVWVFATAGIKEEHFGNIFMSKGRVFTVCGLSASSPRFPILARSTDGKVYKFTTSVIPLFKAAA